MHFEKHKIGFNVSVTIPKVYYRGKSYENVDKIIEILENIKPNTAHSKQDILNLAKNIIDEYK